MIMRKKRFLNLSKLLIIAALFACVFSYRIYAEEPKNEGSGTDDTVNTEGTGSGGNDSSGNGSGNQGEGSGPFSNDNGNQNEGTDSSGNAGTGNDPAAPALTTVAGTGAYSTTPGSNSGNDEGNGQNGNGGDAPKSPTVKEAGDFLVTGPDENSEFDEEKGVLVIKGDVSVKNKDDVEITGQSIIVSASCTVVLEGINIEAAKGPAILIGSPNNVTLALADNTVNTVTGAPGVNVNATKGSFAGIEVEFEFEDTETPANKMASLTINGNGTLNATGNANAAGIGGSNSAGGSKGRGLYGNITIDSGTINATGTGGGAGIGSSNNPNGGTSIGSFKATGYNTWGTITINGGKVTARAGNAAGIGGGNHVDSGKIIINGGTIDAKGNSGIGCGTGSSKNMGNNDDSNKGPGYYFVDIEINGGDITATASGDDNWGGAGIGGGGYADAIIKITGGTIKAQGGSCKDHNSFHHGGAGIGGGYESHANITITGGTIYAYAGYSAAAGIGSGGTPNSNPDRGNTGRSTVEGVTRLTETEILISGGEVHAFAYPENYDSTVAVCDRGGAGIGGGTGADKVTVTITGGTVEAWGAPSNEDDMNGGAGGGAGIGSGLYAPNLTIPGTNNKESAKYQVETDVDISITGGTVLAVGGWGAAGIGSGARNKMANTIIIDNEKADVVAYADGTKFAIDTRDLHEDGSTTSHTEGRTITGYMLQGTLVHDYSQPEGETTLNQNTEGLDDIQVINDETNEKRILTGMPSGYRSFATTVSEQGIYTVYTDSEHISNGGGRYFTEYDYDVIPDTYWDENIDYGRLVQYAVGDKKDQLSDNFYLYPVKSIVVSKEVNTEDGLDVTGINLAAYFTIREKKYDLDGNKITTDEVYLKIKKGEDMVRWIQSIEIVNGVPQNKVYFTNIEDKTYEILEVDEKGEPLNTKTGSIPYGEIILKKISTKHGDLIHPDQEDQSYTFDNDGIISAQVWTDYVTVVNTYGIDNKADIVIRKILPAEYRFDQYTDMTVVFKVQVVNNDGVTYENHVGLTMDTDSARWDSDLNAYVYEKKLKDVPFNPLTDEFNVEEVYTAGYEGTVNAINLIIEEKNKYYRVDTVNTVKDYIPTTGAVNSYSNKAYVPQAVEEGGE